MLRYNTQLKRLRLPEYGRNIQDMVDYCLTISDREERTVCAYSIVAAMANLFPELKSGGEYHHKLWDHLAIMADFNLDIDYPCEVIKSDNLSSMPDPIAYSDNKIRRRHYGKNITKMIDQIPTIENESERMELIRLIANQMKKLLLSVNKDGVDDQRIFHDLAEMTAGEVRINPEDMRLGEYIIPAQPTGKKKKKK